jgi:hypothetical protein
MKYAIAYNTFAIDDLASVWLTATDRTQVTQSIREIEMLLTLHPLKVGESRESSVRRLLHQPPLGIVYEVIEDDKRVIVQGVFLVRI